MILLWNNWENFYFCLITILNNENIRVGHCLKYSMLWFVTNKSKYKISFYLQSNSESFKLVCVKPNKVGFTYYLNMNWQNIYKISNPFSNPYKFAYCFKIVGRVFFGFKRTSNLFFSKANTVYLIINYSIRIWLSRQTSE